MDEKWWKRPELAFILEKHALVMGEKWWKLPE